MAIEIRAPSPPIGIVTTFLPNERETQVLGGTQTHYSVGENVAKALRTHAAGLGVRWLVRCETDLHYPRADGTTGVFYPDLFVAADVALHDNIAYNVRSVGKVPMLVVEVTSKKTAKKDIGPKRSAYAKLGVTEYVTFDPHPRKHLELHGYRLTSPGEYTEIPSAPEGGLWLTTVGLRVVTEAPSRAQLAAERARSAAERERGAVEQTLAAERRVREAAEAAVARLRALLERAGGDVSS